MPGRPSRAWTSCHANNVPLADERFDTHLRIATAFTVARYRSAQPCRPSVAPCRQFPHRSPSRPPCRCLGKRGGWPPPAPALRQARGLARDARWAPLLHQPLFLFLGGRPLAAPRGGFGVEAQGAACAGAPGAKVGLGLQPRPVVGEGGRGSGGKLGGTPAWAAFLVFRVLWAGCRGAGFL